jgi:RNA polymerase-binding transcription factor DksA
LPLFFKNKKKIKAMQVTKRYSQEELELFKIHIEQKLAKSNNDLAFLLDQIQNTTEATDNISDWMDNTSGSDLEMLYTMVSRQRKHIVDLENALIRIRNKNYGICIITGELIDKKRLMAVPTTTKSLAAKNAVRLEDKQPEEESTDRINKPTQNKTIVKITRKPIHKSSTIKFDQDEEDIFSYEDLLDMEDIEDVDTEIDMEDIEDVDTEIDMEDITSDLTS